MTRKRKIVLTLVLALVLIITAVGAVLIHQFTRNSQLEEQRNEALEELERNIGTYDDQSIVLYQTSKANAEELASLLGAELRITKDGRFAKLTLPEGTTIRDVYADDANLEHIEKMAADYQVHIADITEEENVSEERLPTRPKYTVSDSDYALQTYLDYLNMQDVWNYYNGSGVTVAVIDTGIDTDHPEFAGRISEYSYNATEDKIVKDWTDENGNYDWSLIEDEQGHGTAVTGVLAASMNGEGIVGIAPDVNILVIKADCDPNGAFYRTSDLVFGLYYAIERDVQVVNMSFASPDPTNPFAEATRLAVDSDIVCVAAAGNEATAAPRWPAADPNVIGVGALAANSWERAPYSNYGENVDLVAPGTTYTAQTGGDYGTMNGTSFASPTVAGAIALFMQNDPYIMVEDVTEVLYASSYDLGDLGRDWIYGFGALDMSALLLEERGTITYDMLTDELENTEGLFIEGHTLQELPEPERLYAVFDGWYYDDTFTQEYVYYEDKFYGDVTLYAKWANEDDGVPYTYVELEDGTIEIRSYTGKRRYITIPEKIDGKIVSSIGAEAFKGQARLREVGLPSGLKSIKRSAFEGCSNLVWIEIPESVMTIGEKAFADNTRLSSVAFLGNNKLETVGAFAFLNCGSLRMFELPANLKYIDGSALFGAQALTSITVQKGNTAFSSQDGVLFNFTGSKLVAFPAAKGREYTVPAQTKTIGDYAFGYANLATIDLSGITSIGGAAFAYSELEELTIPDATTTVGSSAFYHNLRLASVSIGRGLTSIEQAVFACDSSLEAITIPNTIQIIGLGAFDSSGLTTVTFEENSNLQFISLNAFYQNRIAKLDIPASVASIEAYAFAENPLTELTFVDGGALYSIGAGAFYQCSLLKDVKFPRQLVSIGEMAFAHAGLEAVTVPAGVTTLGNGVFAGCMALTAIDIEDGNAVYHDIDGVVYTLDNTVLHSYPSGRACDYTVHSATTVIAPYAFGFSNVNSVGLPVSLVQISEHAFYSCYNLYSIHIPDNVLQIGRYAFAESWNLYSITFGENAKIPRFSFESFAYTGLQSFTVPANVSTMAQKVFEGCCYLSSITFAENSKLESISAYMFDGCTNLQSITFLPGSKLTSIQAHGLEGMSQLYSINFGNAKLENIDNFAFRFCESLSTLNLPNTVKNVGRYAFYACESLSELSLPETLEHIGSYAFLGTNDLDLYLASESMPAYLDENWDHGIRGYYTGVTNVETSGDYKYATLTSGNLAIIEYLGTDKTVDLTTVNLGAPISVIGGSAFKDSTVEQIILPDTLTAIQAEAFQYSPLKSISIPASVTFIGREAFAHTDIQTLTFAGNANLSVIEQYAFEGTDKLSSVTIPASVTTLGTGVFQKSGLTSVTFSQGIALAEIPQNAFMGTKLTTVALPDSVKTVNHNAFRDILTLKTVSFGNSDGIRLLSNVFYNTGLESLHIPANVTYIGEYCFVGLESLSAITVDENNPNYKSVDGLLLTKSGKKLVTVPAGRTGSLTVPISVEEIGFGAFENSALDEILFDPNANILTFGYRAFFGAKNLTAIHIPASVVSIDYYAFAYCEKLHTVTFAEGNQMKGIYEGAFCGDINLENITIPDAIVEISDFAFYGCSKITKLPISDTHNLKGIYDYAFAYTSIGGEFTTPETLIDIGPYAFLGTDITKLTIPDTNKKDLIIGIGAFEGCNKLTEVTLPFIGASYEDEDISWFGYIFGAGSYQANGTYVPASLKTVTISDGITFVGTGGFYQCASLETIHVPHSVSVVFNYAFGDTDARYELTNKIATVKKETRHLEFCEIRWGHFGKGITGSVIIDEGVTALCDSAFAYCNNLISITLPESLTRIDSWAFAECENLQTVNGAENVALVGSYAFGRCYKLVDLNFTDALHTVDGSAFCECTSLVSIGDTNNLSYIGSSAFDRCVKLQKVTVSDSLQTIMNGTFYMCESLEQIKLPSALLRIEDYAFVECALNEVVIPEGTISIGQCAFAHCENLSKVTLPDSLESIGACAFSYSNFESVTIGEGISSIGAEAFSYCSNLKYAKLPEGLQTIETGLFYYCEKLEKVNIPESVTVIGERAFCNCAALTEISLPHNVTTISVCAFERCGNLANVTLPDSLQSIGGFAFSECYALQKIDIPASVTSIGFNAFSSCEKLTSVTLSDGLESIEEWAFAYTAIKDLVIPDSVEHLGAAAFYHCTQLQTVELSEALTEISSGAFIGCALTEIVIPEGIHTIMDTAFNGCGKLVNVQLPSSLKTLGSSAFSSCYSLREIIIPDGVEVIDQGAFAYCSSLEKITLPSALTEIRQDAFYACNKLTSIVNRSELQFEIGSQDHGFVAENAYYVVDKNGNKTYRQGYFTEGDFLFCYEEGVYKLRAYLGAEDTVTLPLDVGGNPYVIYAFYGAERVIIPDGMTEISDQAFENHTELKHISIPNSVESIGSNAFMNCYNLAEIELPSNLVAIDRCAFSCCTSLRSVQIPDSVTELGTNLFDGCTSLTSVTLPKQLMVIPSHFFTYCVNLTSVTLPDSVTVIEPAAFYHCENLQTINIPQGVYSIGFDAFAYCDSLKLLQLPEAVTEIGAHAFASTTQVVFQGDNANFRFIDGVLYNNPPTTVLLANPDVTNVVIPEGITTIGSQVFEGCTNLISVTLPQTLISIEWNAFAGCTSLESITIPDSVSEIGTWAFYGCSSLSKVTLPSQITQIPSGLFSGCTELTSVVIPDSVHTINYGAFENCTSLTEIKIPRNVTQIDGNTFYNCTSLTKIELPSSLTQIGSWAFYNCTNLADIELPSTLIQMDAYAFHECHSLTDIVLPAGVKLIEDGVFFGCSGLKTVVLPEGLQQISSYLFLGCTSLETVVVPESVTTIASQAFDDCSGLRQITLPQGLRDLGNSAFSGCSSLESIAIPQGVTILPENLFAGCGSLVSVELHDSISIIESSAFSECDSLRQIDLPNSLTQIGGFAFGECDRLECVDIPDNVTTLGDGIFWACKQLQTVKLPCNISAIPSSTFYACVQLQTVVIPAGITEINSYAFYECNNLRSVSFPEGLVKIGETAFYRCNSLTALEIPASVKEIGYSAFYSCDGIKTLTFKGDATEIGETAFSSCNGLTELSLPANISKIRANAFSGCGNLQNLNIPESVTEIEAQAFQYCHSLDIITLPANLISIGEDAFSGCDTRIVYNNSNLELKPGDESHGGIASFAVAIFDKNHNVTAAEGHGVQGDFIFWFDESRSEVRYYLGDSETVVYPTHYNDIPCVVTSFEGGQSIKHLIIPEGITSISACFGNLTNLETVEIPDSVTDIGSYIFRGCEKITYDQEYLAHGMYVYDGWLLGIDESVKYLYGIEGIRYLASGVYADLHQLKEMIWPNNVWAGYTSNVETIYVPDLQGSMPLPHSHHTLKNIIICDAVSPDALYHHPEFFYNITGVTIYVEALEQDLRWDDNFPGWNNGNKVIYGDEWNWVTFYDENGRIISREPKLNSEIIRLPVREIESDQLYSYRIIGWDLDGDGAKDSIPATTAINLELRPIVQKSLRQYTVNFADQNGSIYHSLTLPYGTEMVLPEEPFKQGHDFAGWLGYTEGMTVTSDITFVAQWKHHGNGHTYGEPVWTAPTCTEQGYNKHTCTICGEYYGTDYTDALGHDYQSKNVAPTCTEKGYTLHTCTICGETYQTDSTAAAGHSYSKWSVDQAPTCTQVGSRHRSCAVCDAREDESVPANGHSYVGEVVTEPTCSVEGTMRYTCTECGSQVDESLPTIPHQYEKRYVSKSWLRLLIEHLLDVLFGYEGDRAYYFACTECDRICTVDEEQAAGAGVASSACMHVLADWTEYISATCSGNNVEARICTLCDKPIELREGKASAFDHTIVIDEAVKATCTADGLTEGKHCSVCGEVLLKQEIVPSLGHDTVEREAKAPTCAEIGWEAYTTCTRCDYTTYAELPALGHDIVMYDAKAPTCTEIGWEAFEACTRCDYTTYNEISVSGHTMGEWYTITAPTCTTAGTEQCICQNCDYTEIRTVEALGHATANYDAKEPTCLEIGWTAYETCTRCDYTTYAELSALGHAYAFAVAEPTCTEDGYTTYTCANCGDTYTDEIVYATGHAETTIQVNSNCTEDGYRAVHCTICFAELSHEVLPATGHSYNGVVTQPTCTAEGFTTYTCHCGDSYVADYVNATGHSFGDWYTVTEPTCTAEGTERRDCANCEHYETQAIAATGHSYESVVTAPTCTEQGYTTYTCHCGDSYTADYVDATGHTYESVVTEPTCTEKGYVTYTCHCGDTYTGNYIPAVGHSWDEGVITVEPTEEQAGRKVYTCAVCGETEEETLPPLEHIHRYEGMVTEPTCTEQGFTTYACRCGDSYVSDYTDAKGHSFGEWYTVTDPTCTADGTERRDCADCDVSETQTIAATGHKYDATVTEPTCTEQGFTTYTCYCGDSYVSDYVDPAGHAWSEWYDTIPGMEERSCNACGETEGRDKIPDYDVNRNGTVDQADVTLLISVLVGNTETDVLHDFDFDGELTIYDCVLLMQQID